MREAVARDKFHCANCGADAHWNPGKQALVCPYCGTVGPVTEDPGTGTIHEHDLLTALREVSDSARGWKAEKVAVKCQSCQAISVFDPQRVAQRCDFCGAAQLVAYEQTRAPISPESLLPFKITENQVRDSIREWYGQHWFAPNALKTRALTDRVHGIYVPYWTFDAHAEADWTAESGYYYYEMETFRDQNGRLSTRRVQRIRWEPSAGHLQHFFDDALVSGTKGVEPGLLRMVEPFPTKELVPYEAGFVAGWVVEQYQVDLRSAAARSEEDMDSELRTLCARQVPGDTHQNLRVDATYSAQTFKHILVPVWLLTYTYGSQTYQVVVNGYTGAIAGKHPISWIKVALVVLMVLIFAGVVVMLANK